METDDMTITIQGRRLPTDGSAQFDIDDETDLTYAEAKAILVDWDIADADADAALNEAAVAGESEV